MFEGIRLVVGESEHLEDTGESSLADLPQHLEVLHVLIMCQFTILQQLYNKS